MLRSILLAAALVSAAAPAFADNHRGKGGNNRHDNRGDRGGGRDNHRNDNRGNWNGNHNNNWNNNRNWNNNSYRDNHHNHSSLSLSLGVLLGAPYRTSYDRYDDYGYSSGWNLYPGQCRWDREFAYWRGRPAEVEVKRCADGYGSVYIVSGAQRLWRYR